MAAPPKTAPPPPEEPDEDADESAVAVVVALVVALVSAFLVQVNVCAGRHACLQKGTCVKLDTDSSALYSSCSFKTTLSPSFYKMLNSSTDSSALARIQRGVCPIGLVEELTPSHKLACRRRRAYPNALALDIESAGESVPHRRWCGKWIDSSSALFETVRWAFLDEELVAQRVEEIFEAKSVSSLATNNMQKFQSACRTMTVSGAVGAASVSAYALVKSEMRDGSDEESLLESMGVLASFYCDAPLSVGVTLAGGRFAGSLSEGRIIAPNDLTEALYVVGESRDMRELAERFAKQASGAKPWELVEVDDAQARRVFFGAHSSTWVDELMGPPFEIAKTVFLPSLERFLFAFAVLGAAAARAYLNGVAATCALTARSITTGELGTLSSSAHNHSHTHAPLGRLEAPQWERFRSVSAEEVEHASQVGLSALHARLSNFGAFDARDACARATVAIFPEQVDQLVFNQLVTPKGHARLEAVVSKIRAAVVEELRGEFGGLFSRSQDQNAAIDKVLRLHVTIPGSPALSWSGRRRVFRAPEFRADEGALQMMLLQTRAVFLDRIASVIGQAGLHELAPLFSATERNAYLYLSSTDATAALLPGLFAPPFWDESYDDESVYARVGYVVAHELAHVTAFDGQWNAAYATQLLQSYQPEHRVEAVADLLGARAILRTGFVNGSRLCAHISQLWCARTGVFALEGYGVHPPANERGDLICESLKVV